MDKPTTRHPIVIANRCEDFIHATERHFKHECLEKQLNPEECQILAEELAVCLQHVSHEVAKDTPISLVH